MSAAPVIIAGAGPAGLTAAAELLAQTSLPVTVCEASDMVGGISRTIDHNGNRMDLGGHRFFSKSRRVNEFWDAHIGMAERPRLSRIYFLRRFFDYPVTMSARTLRNMGLWRTLRAGLGFMAARLRPLPETSLENFYINRFGRPLYSMFFEDYTEKVWGVHPSRLGADWGSQRVKGLSVSAVLRDMWRKRFGHKDDAGAETSLIEHFRYPPLGPGQLWEAVACDIVGEGAELMMQTRVTEVHVESATRRVTAVTLTDAEGRSCRRECSHLLSSMPLRHLVAAIRGVDIPEEVRRTAAELPYRDFITVGVLLPRESLAVDLPDTWIYVQDRGVRLGRIQVFNNWSPQLVRDPQNTVWLGLEYFCNEGDAMWEASDGDFIARAVEELRKIGIIREDAEPLDSVRVRVPKAYPAYHGAYGRLGCVRQFLDTIPNLWCIGRNGQHRYNNMDHSMLTAMEAADAIAAGSPGHTAVWQVNTEADYHEAK